MKLKGAASRRELFRNLAAGFDETLITELIPGIIHNFANPLNGIMGRATLLQRRTMEQVKKMRTLYPEMPAEIATGLEKVLQDTDLIVRETDRFFSIFRDLTVKFAAIVPREEENIDLSQLIASEMRFADFYLDFKHDVKKTLSLEENLPAVRGVYAIYSLCLSALLRTSMRVMKDAEKKDFSIATRHSAQSVFINIQHTGLPVRLGKGEKEGRGVPGSDAPSGTAGAERELFNVMAMLEDCGAHLRIERKDEITDITIEIPIAKASPAPD
jgi:signal transduction histidine kinase